MGKKYSVEFIENFARQFHYRRDFAKASPSIYNCAIKRHILDRVCQHMKRLRPPRAKTPKEHWDRTSAEAALAKCETKKEFREKYPRAYSHAVRHGYWKEISEGMGNLGDFNMRRIYVFEFADHHAYVGLSCDTDRRQTEHMRDASPVGEHIVNECDDWKFFVLTDWLDKDAAGRKEEEMIEAYKAKGWIMLNRAPGGGLGHARDAMYSIGQIAGVAAGYDTKQEFKKGEPSMYSFAYRHGFLDKVCKHMRSGRKKIVNWPNERLDEIVARCKTPSNVGKENPYALKLIRERGLYEHYFGHAYKPIKRKITLEYAIEECKKYHSAPEVHKNDVGLYNTIYKRGWQDQCYGQYAKRHQSPKVAITLTFDKVMAVIDICSSFKEFRLGHPIEYRAAMRNEEWRQELYRRLPKTR